MIGSLNTCVYTRCERPLFHISLQIQYLWEIVIVMCFYNNFVILKMKQLIQKIFSIKIMNC